MMNNKTLSMLVMVTVAIAALFASATITSYNINDVFAKKKYGEECCPSDILGFYIPLRPYIIFIIATLGWLGSMCLDSPDTEHACIIDGLSEICMEETGGQIIKDICNAFSSNQGKISLESIESALTRDPALSEDQREEITSRLEPVLGTPQT